MKSPSRSNSSFVRFWCDNDGLNDSSMVKGRGPVFVGWCFGDRIDVRVVQCFIANKLMSPDIQDVGYLGSLEIHGWDFRGIGLYVGSI